MALIEALLTRRPAHGTFPRPIVESRIPVVSHATSVELPGMIADAVSKLEKALPKGYLIEVWSSPDVNDGYDGVTFTFRLAASSIDEPDADGPGLGDVFRSLVLPTLKATGKVVPHDVNGLYQRFSVFVGLVKRVIIKTEGKKP